MHRIRCTFRPQAWELDAATVPRPNSFESDALTEHENAPEWIRRWRGPFEVDFEVVG